MATEPTLARIWPARTLRDKADEYEPYLRAGGIPPREETAPGFHLFRDDRKQETWFPFISYWSDMEAMRAFTKGEPTKVHLPPRDDEFLIEKPDRVGRDRILVDSTGATLRVSGQDRQGATVKSSIYYHG